jgi:anti-sigma-K factor RskA
MSLADEIGPGEGGDEIVAAEYVLGVLPADERHQASLRIDAEQAFASLVDRWEAYFAPLAAGYAAVEAPASVKPAVDRRLFAVGATPVGQAPAVPGLWSSLGLWRGLAIATFAAIALYIALPVLNPPVGTPQPRLVASLVADGSDVRYLAFYDPASHEIGLSHVTGERAAGRDFELWVIEGQEPPASLGVIPVGATVQLPVDTAALRAKLSSGAVFAISLEPSGGSPTGSPTGPVVAAGDLRAI